MYVYSNYANTDHVESLSSVSNRNISFNKGWQKSLVAKNFDYFETINSPKKKNFDLSVLKDFVIKILGKNKKAIQEGTITVNSLLIACFLGFQSEKDFFAEIGQHEINGDYVAPNQSVIARIVSDLERKKVINPEAPYDSPRFYNGLLSDTAYEDILQKVKDAPSYVLNDMEKKSIINSLAKSNYHNEDIIWGNDVSFRGNTSEDPTDTVNDTDVDVDNVDDDGSILYAILDFFDDLF